MTRFSPRTARMVEPPTKLAPGHATLLVEHDMDAVFAVGDAITERKAKG